MQEYYEDATELLYTFDHDLDLVFVSTDGPYIFNRLLEWQISYLRKRFGGPMNSESDGREIIGMTYRASKIRAKSSFFEE